MKLRYLALLLPLVVVAGCATNPSDANVAANDAQKGGINCERTSRTGTMFAKKECDQPLTPEERAQMQDTLSRIRPSASQPPGK